MLLALFLTMSSGNAFVQASGTATNSATTARWKGCNIDTLKSTTKFYLYNVGTGRFLMQGGYWGVQGMLLYQDYGAGMFLKQNYVGTDTRNSLDREPRNVILSGAANLKDVSGKTINGICLGINYPAWTNNKQSTWTNPGAYLIFNGEPGAIVGGDGYSRGWTFQRVESSDNTSTYTYYMKETLKNTATFRSECHQCLCRQADHDLPRASQCPHRQPQLHVAPRFAKRDGSRADHRRPRCLRRSDGQRELPDQRPEL